MQAIRVEKHGGPEVSQIASVEKPKAGKGEVLIKVKAAGINPVDLLILAGSFPHQALPFTPGFDGAGIIEEIGEGVKCWQVGSRVWFFLSRTGGAFAEYVVCKESSIGHLPEHMSFEQGAALGIPYNTAHRALFYTVNVRPGQTVLIHGASGATGIACAQLAYGAGCRVWGTASTEEGADTLRKMHVEKVFNHRKEGYVDEIKAAAQGNGVDVIIEMMANANLPSDLELIKPRGSIVIIGSKGNLTFNPFQFLSVEAKVSGVLLFFATEDDQREAFSHIDRGMELGYINPIVAKTLPLKDAYLAFEELNTASGRKGKIVLLP